MNLLKRMMNLKGSPKMLLTGKKHNRYLIYPEDDQLIIESDNFVAKVDYQYENLLNKTLNQKLTIINELLTTK